jgi:hypothetical protein
VGWRKVSQREGEEAVIDDPLKMVRGIIMLAPELNMKVALLNLVDYIDDVISAEDFDEEQKPFRIENLLEVVVESLVKLHHHVDEDDDEGFGEEFNVGGRQYTDSPITNEELIKFQKMLGLFPDDENKEETNE